MVEEKIATGSKNANDSRELYLGLLYPTEDYKVYGYVTNTKVARFYTLFYVCKLFVSTLIIQRAMSELNSVT